MSRSHFHTILIISFLAVLALTAFAVLAPFLWLANDIRLEYNDQEGVFLVLLYHSFAEEPITEPGLYTTAEKFESDIQALLSDGLKPLSLYDYAGGNYNSDGRYFAITFDDGYLTNYTVSFPILQKLNIPATIFKNTDNDFMEHHFSYEQAREMEASGLIAIQSHLPTHISATELEIDEFIRELERSFEVLEQELGERPHRLFAYPYGTYTRETYESARDSGIALQFVQEKHINAPGLILRNNVSYDTDFLSLGTK